MLAEGETAITTFLGILAQLQSANGHESAPQACQAVWKGNSCPILAQVHNLREGTLSWLVANVLHSSRHPVGWGGRVHGGLPDF